MWNIASVVSASLGEAELSHVAMVLLCGPPSSALAGGRGLLAWQLWCVAEGGRVCVYVAPGQRRWPLCAGPGRACGLVHPAGWRATRRLRLARPLARRGHGWDTG